MLASGILWSPPKKNNLANPSLRALVKRTALLAPGFIFIAFSTAHSRQSVQIYPPNFYVAVIHDFPIYHKVFCDKSNI